MIRKIIKIDEEKCNGCGLCADACHEGAIEIVDGKAILVRENFCHSFPGEPVIGKKLKSLPKHATKAAAPVPG